MEQNLKKCPLCGKEFDENTDDYGFNININGKQEHITKMLLPNDEEIAGYCSQCRRIVEAAIALWNEQPPEYQDTLITKHKEWDVNV